MKFKINQKIIPAVLITAFALGNFACQNSAPVANKTNSTTKTNTSTVPMPEVKAPTMTDVPVGNAQTPTEAYRMLFAAVKSQDTAKIKSMYSKSSIGLAEAQAARSNQSIEKVYANGFTETTFADDYPQMRDERIKGDYGAVEVFNAARKQWDDVPFVLEDGTWKLAVGDAFGGKWQSPGKGQTIIEQENANANNPNMKMINPLANSNTNTAFNGAKRLPKPKNQ